MPVGAGFIPARIGENKKMTEHKKLQPEIRFAGFTDDWEQRKLGDVVNVLDNLRIPIAASQRLEGVTPYYGANGIQGYIDGFTHDGEFVLVAEDGANDLINYPVQYVSGKVWINNHAHVLQGIKNVANNLFLVYRIKSMDMTKYLVGGGRTKLNASVMKDIELHLPNYAEQTQIGNFFKQLDDTIALHQREFEKFKILRKAYLKHIFIDNTTQFRAEKTIPWEQRKLGEFSKTTIGEFVIKTKQNPNSKYPVYNGGVSYTGFYDDFNNNGHKIIVSARGANAGFINIINGKYWAGNSCYSIDIQSDNYCIEYVYHFMKHKQHLFTDFQQAANIPSVSKKNVEEFLISYPRSKEEQTQIGNFFKQLDDTIALHQREFEKFKILRKAYLKHIFIDNTTQFRAEKTIPWEQCKLGDVVNIIMGQSPDSKNYTNNSSDHILVQGNADIKNGFVYPRVWTTQITKQGHSGDLIMSVRAPVGDIAKTEYDVVLGRGVCAIKGNEFIFQLLTKMKENDYWESLSTGSTFDSINSNDIKNAEIFIPSLEEQTQIGNFFKQLDDTIALHQKELAKYQQIKTACLEKMFVE